MRRRRRIPIELIIILLVVIILFIFILKLFHKSPESEAKALVRSFYQHEMEADFGSSWELFHPLMKEKFEKADYIQQRNHVFVGHFGTDTFKFTMGEVKKLNTWKMSTDVPVLENVYLVPITQTYKSTYGTFTIHQDVYVAKDNRDWGILWSYE